jgi:hypothetical protein
MTSGPERPDAARASLVTLTSWILSKYSSDRTSQGYRSSVPKPSSRGQRYDVLAVRQHDSPDRDLVHIADGLADHREGVVSDLAVRAQIVGTDTADRSRFGRRTRRSRWFWSIPERRQGGLAVIPNNPSRSAEPNGGPDEPRRPFRFQACRPGRAARPIGILARPNDNKRPLWSFRRRQDGDIIRTNRRREGVSKWTP